jgi:DNA-binding PadR family transcriptional regulator
MPRPIVDPGSFVPLADLPFQILLALGEGASHGYAIGKEIEERTSGRLNPTTGSLYQALRRLREDGLISPLDAAPDGDNGDPRRRYFQLTALGRRVMALEVGRLESLVSLARERSLAPKRS